MESLQALLENRGYRRLLIYGGSFDPPHRAHVELPPLVRDQLGLDAVVYMPAGQPPHKQGRQITPAHHRLAMLELALADLDRVLIDPWELRQAGPSWTVQTLEHLREEVGPEVELRLLMGADMAAIFYQWREAERVKELAEPVVMLRPPEDADSLLAKLPEELDEATRARWRERIVTVPTMAISSTQLRERLREGAYDDPVLRASLPPRVLEYIQIHGLYQPTQWDSQEI